LLLWLAATITGWILVKNLRDINALVFLCVGLVVICNRDCRAIFRNLLFGISNRLFLPSMETELLSVCRTHKKIRVWSCADIFQVFYQNQNHPESAKSVSKHSTTSVQPSEVSDVFGKKEPNRSNQAEQDQKTLIRIGWSILLYLSIRDQKPDWLPLAWLLTALIAAPLLMLIENLYEFASKLLASVVQISDVKNPMPSSGEKEPFQTLENQQNKDVK
jgi:hypothetical protein